ncbi:MAG TPA: PEPxxWA-CTERM sorting domain-containing protein [Caulobacteraceae bacterium]
MLTAGSGWVNDTANSQNTPSANSTITLTIDHGQIDVFSLSDCCVPGDSYRVTVDGFASYTSTLGLLPTYWTPTGSGQDLDWANPALSHLQITFTDPNAAPLTLTLSIVDLASADGGPGYPAGFEYRLDPVPEPAAWALMLGGFGMAGGALRMRRRALAA